MLDVPREEIANVLATATTIAQHRLAEPVPARPTMARRSRPVAAGAAVGANTTRSGQPRQRAVRSDAGKPRAAVGAAAATPAPPAPQTAQTAHSTPTRRRMTTPPPLSAPAGVPQAALAAAPHNPLPDQFVPVGAED